MTNYYLAHKKNFFDFLEFYEIAGNRRYLGQNVFQYIRKNFLGFYKVVGN